MMTFRFALRNLFRNPRRTAAVLLTIAMGTTSLVIFYGFNSGLMNQYRDNTVHSRYGHGQINTHGYRDKAFEKPWDHWITNYGEVKTAMRSRPEVEHLFPRVEFFALMTNGRITLGGRGQGIDGPEEARFFTTMNIEEGKMLSDEPDGVILGKGLARALDVHPGDRVTVLSNTVNGSMNGIDLTVTGIFHTGLKDFDDVVFRLPLKQAQTLLDTDRIESVALGLRSVQDWPAVSKLVNEKFPTLDAIPFAVLDKVYYQQSVDWLDSQFGVIRAIILAVVLLGIFNTVSTGILERKQEIGNMKANGESASDVLRLLFLEGVLLGVSGAILGVLLAYAVNLTLLRGGILMPPAPGITRQFHIFIELSPKTALEVFVMGALTAAIGAALAGIRVARMPIGEALRST